MKKRSKVLTACAMSLVLAGSIFVAGCSSETEETHEAVELQIFAANSMSSAMDEAMAVYSETYDWVTFADAQYLSSGNLVEELSGGAYADIFISASQSKMDEASEEGLIVDDTRIDLYDNELVVIAQEGSDIQIDSLEDIITGGYSLAVGDDSVPAGNYAAQSFYSIGYYSDSSGVGGEYTGIDADKLITGSSVGNVAQYVSSGEVDLAIVFLSDSYRYDGVEVIYTIPDDMHESIIYPAAVCSVSEYQEEAQAFLEWCATDPAAEEIWQKWGFSLAS